MGGCYRGLLKHLASTSGTSMASELLKSTRREGPVNTMPETILDTRTLVSGLGVATVLRTQVGLTQTTQGAGVVWRPDFLVTSLVAVTSAPSPTMDCRGSTR